MTYALSTIKEEMERCTVFVEGSLKAVRKCIVEAIPTRLKYDGPEKRHPTKSTPRREAIWYETTVALRKSPAHAQTFS